MKRERLVEILLMNGDVPMLADIVMAELNAEERRRTAPTGLTHQPQMTLLDNVSAQIMVKSVPSVSALDCLSDCDRNALLDVTAALSFEAAESWMHEREKRLKP